jgi:excisionase family DNA binding protein
MAEFLQLRQAARLAGVSPNRLYRAIASGRLRALPGGGPGKSTLIEREALSAWCLAEGIPLAES